MELQKMVNSLRLYASQFSRVLLGHLSHALDWFLLILIAATAAPNRLSLLIGIPISIIGELLVIWAQGYKRKDLAWQISGPYRFVRHPYLLGRFLLFLGAVVAARTFPGIIFLLISTILIITFITAKEDAILIKTGGERYKDYKLMVSAFIPNCLPYPHKQDQAFSFHYALFNARPRQIDSIIAYIIGLLLLYGFLESPQLKDRQFWVAGVLVVYFLTSKALSFRKKLKG